MKENYLVSSLYFYRDFWGICVQMYCLGSYLEKAGLLLVAPEPLVEPKTTADKLFW